jgi:hypothetical protein
LFADNAVNQPACAAQVVHSYNLRENSARQTKYSPFEAAEEASERISR